MYRLNHVTDYGFFRYGSYDDASVFDGVAVASPHLPAPTLYTRPLQRPQVAQEHRPQPGRYLLAPWPVDRLELDALRLVLQAAELRVYSHEALEAGMVIWDLTSRAGRALLWGVCSPRLSSASVHRAMHPVLTVRSGFG